jgi:hypothetical protein
MDDILRRLQSLPPSKWGYHERYMCKKLGMSVKEGVTVRKQLGQLLSALREGGWGQKRNKTWTSTGLPMMDLGDTSIPNIMDIHYTSHGSQELFPTDSPSEASGAKYAPRYFMIGALKAPGKQGPNVHRITSQCLIMKIVTGQTTKGLDKESQQRRQANWLPWYQKDDSNGKKTEFDQMDLPLIANTFREVWDVIIPDEDQSRIQPSVLAAIGQEIRVILQSCDQICAD